MTRGYESFDLSDFTIGTMLRTGLAIRRMLNGTDTLDEAANILVRYLYERGVSVTNGERSCALVRFYRTTSYSDLAPELKDVVAAQFGEAVSDTLQCLTLVATAGDEPEWNDRAQSRGHRAIPLSSVDAVRRAPMIARLIEDLGMDISSVVSGGLDKTDAPAVPRTYDVFHVEDAKGSPHIPAQAFVTDYGIESVIGFGGQLRSGQLFTTIIFSRVHIPKDSAMRFRSIALDLRSALFTFE